MSSDNQNYPNCFMCKSGRGHFRDQNYRCHKHDGSDNQNCVKLDGVKLHEDGSVSVIKGSFTDKELEQHFPEGSDNEVNQ